jgi:WD40 repeat protein
VWNPEGGRQLAVTKQKNPEYGGAFHILRMGISPLSFSPDGNHIAFSDREAITEFDVKRKRISAIYAQAEHLYVLRYSRDGKFIAAARNRQAGKIWRLTVIVWDRTTRKSRIITTKDMPKEVEVPVIAFLKDGTLAIAGHSSIQIWDPHTGKQRRGVKIAKPLGGRVPFINFDGTGTQCLVSTEKAKVLIDLFTGNTTEFPPERPRDGNVRAVSPGLGAVGYAAHGRIELVDARSNSTIFQTQRAGIASGTPGIIGEGILGIRQFGAEDVVKVYSNRFWDLERLQFRRFTESIPFIKDGRLFVIEQGQLYLIPDAGNPGRRQLQTTFDTADQFTRNYRLGPLPTRNCNVVYAVADDLRSIRFWNPKTGKVEETLKFSQPLVGSAQSGKCRVSPDGQFVVVGTGFNYRIWRRGEKSPRDFARLGWSTAHAPLDISPDGRMLAASSDATFFELWDIPSRKRIVRITTGLTNPLFLPYLEFSRTGRYLFFTRQVWDVKSQKLVWEMPEPDHMLPAPVLAGWRCGSIFPDERHVAMSQNGRFQIWDFLKNKKKATLFFLPGDEWAFVNHETGHWKGSPLAFQYVRFALKEGTKTIWLNPLDYEQAAGWKTDPARALPTFLARKPVSKNP